MTDDDPAIASLLEDAARFATAANEKLAEALAIAEQARRDAAFNADRAWFKARPDRNFRARLATGPRDRGPAQERRRGSEREPGGADRRGRHCLKRWFLRGEKSRHRFLLT